MQTTFYSLEKKGTQMMNRRNMLKTSLLAGTAVTFGCDAALSANQEQENEIYGGGSPWGDVLGWRLGSQAWGFHLFTTEETVQKLASMGLRVIEGNPNQRISKNSDLVMNFKMTQSERYLVRSILVEHNVTMPNFGGVEVTQESIEFALDMGVETLLIEPPPELLPQYDKLADEYGIDLSIHNHPKDSYYWNYATTLERIKDLSPRTGVCADTGHYMRSGIEPVEAIRALKGHIKSLHVKDLNRREGPSHDVPWGTGVCHIAEVLKELKTQYFKGVFLAEYEHNWDNPVPEISQCVKFFNEQARLLCQS